MHIWFIYLAGVFVVQHPSLPLQQLQQFSHLQSAQHFSFLHLQSKQNKYRFHILFFFSVINSNNFFRGVQYAPSTYQVHNRKALLKWLFFFLNNFKYLISFSHFFSSINSGNRKIHTKNLSFSFLYNAKLDNVLLQTSERLLTLICLKCAYLYTFVVVYTKWQHKWFVWRTTISTQYLFIFFHSINFCFLLHYFHSSNILRTVMHSLYPARVKSWVNMFLDNLRCDYK